MYDFTHCICDAIEHISHSLCTLEFADHRPLYDWVLDNIAINYHPPQIEFSRLGLEYTVMSKRLLHRLVDEQLVSGWDDLACQLWRDCAVEECLPSDSRVLPAYWCDEARQCD